MAEGISKTAWTRGSGNTYMDIYDRYRTLTMIPQDEYVANLELAYRFSGIDGAIVECGTWKGGMIAGIAHLLGNTRQYWLFDSFEGLPPAKDQDGEKAKHWQADKKSPTYYDNCTASLHDAQMAMQLAGVANARILKGWFEATLPEASFPEGIDILRMDADWYDSTMDILKYCFVHVNDGGCLIIDDYYRWDGCAKAVHDFLSKNRCIERIYSHKSVCYIVKSNDEWNSRVDLLKRDIAGVIPLGHSLILVDDNKLGAEATVGYCTKQFIEKDGCYWGAPPDDNAAISELECMCRNGASFIAFAWPAFWWLDYYEGMHEYLCTNFTRLLENDRLVVFDMRRRQKN